MTTAFALLGPTASGKTDIAVKLVEQFPFEIVSVDASQVYIGMDIGTAKPDARILARAPHHLIDFRQPANAYSAADFCADALPVMWQIKERGHIPLIVGGSMFYFQALVSGLNPAPAANQQFREDLRQTAIQLGWPALHERLSKIDPASAARINIHDSQRIERALEINEISGKPVPPLAGTLRNGATTDPDNQWDYFTIALAPSDRSLLHKRIGLRFMHMLDQGLEHEVQMLLRKLGAEGEDTPALRTVGYRQVAQYLRGTISRDEMTAKATAATRQLAKRQLTWLRHRPGTVWCDANLTAVDDAISELIVNKLRMSGPEMELSRT